VPAFNATCAARLQVCGAVATRTRPRLAARVIAELLALPLLVVLAGFAWLAARHVAQHRALRQLARQYEAELAARKRAAARAAWLDAALEATREGVLVADAALRVVHWNGRFAALTGLPAELPREGATLASLLRLSAEAGEFGLVDVDQEVARNLALIEQGPSVFPRLRHRPDGSIVEFVLEPVPAGGILLRCTDVTARHRAPPAPAPTAPARPPAPPPPPSAEPAMPPRTRRAHVLLVEDMRVNQIVTATQLRRDGHRVDIAESGAEAVALAGRQPYDLVLMDLMMPGMSGYDAAARIRALPPPAGRLPIYALTANTGDEERARCLAAGMQGMLSKPVPAVLLREVLGGAPTAMAATPPPAAAPAPTMPGGGALDMARLAELRRDLPPATLATLCRQCLDDMAERLAALSDALSAGQAEAIEREAHALAGMAGSYGLGAIERQSRAILAAARAADADAARNAAAGIAANYASSRAALLAWAVPARG
jgi:CheY-like chemotaxis protein/PAS domain-containing protein/HPt (histidine-containing phosphotransfer) domain-containing protein